MSTAPKLLALQEIQEPPEALTEALSAEFLRPLLIENPPPARLARLEKLGGFCPSQDYSEHGEIVLASPDFPGPFAAVEGFRSTYLHEIVHKFLNGYQEDEIGGSHGPAFHALLLTLLMRAGDRSSCRLPWFIFSKIYDFQDAWLAKAYTPGEALDWACALADDLAPAKISAESAAAEIVRRFTTWRSAMAQAPARRSAARKKQEAAQTDLEEARGKIFWWRMYFCFSSFLAAVFLFLAIQSA